VILENHKCITIINENACVQSDPGGFPLVRLSTGTGNNHVNMRNLIVLLSHRKVGNRVGTFIAVKQSIKS